jgi:hypothetical protein
MNQCRSHQFFAVILAGLLVASPCPGQEAPAVRKLNIVIIEGDGAVNNVKQRLAREPVVQVTDENNRPIGGAAVTFFLPNQGAGGSFTGGRNFLTVITDSNGRATASGLRANTLAGQYAVRVAASYQGVSASASIAMSNAVLTAGGLGAGLGLGSLSFWQIVPVIAMVGTLAGTGTIAAIHGQDITVEGPGGSAAKPPTTVTPGTPVVGPPR